MCVCVCECNNTHACGSSDLSDSNITFIIYFTLDHHRNSQKDPKQKYPVVAGYINKKFTYFPTIQ